MADNSSIVLVVVLVVLLVAAIPAAAAMIGTFRQGKKLLVNTNEVPELLEQLHLDLKSMAEKLDTRGQQIEAMQATIGTIHHDTNHAFVSVKEELVVAKDQIVSAKDELVELKRQVTSLIPEKKP